MRGPPMFDHGLQSLLRLDASGRRFGQRLYPPAQLMKSRNHCRPQAMAGAYPRETRHLCAPVSSHAPALDEATMQ